MDASKYLRRYRRLIVEVEHNRIKMQRLRGLCEQITVDMTREKVQSSGSKDKLGETVARLADLETETLDKVNEALDAMNDIEGLINQLDDTDQAEILQMMYIEGYNALRVANVLGCSPATVYRKREKALRNIEKLAE